ncbi:MAG TPA: N-acetyl-gamma-glutamyl-phosphate reductase [Thermoplasmata archaeon]|nr:N-acetyl-gamma-glutamyl-phosphate reductase [Thermoplasmata archaeon]
MPTVAVLGASGYLGGELLRLLSFHPQLELVAAVSESHAGKSLGEIHPNLAPDGALVALPDASTVDADLAFLAQPAGEAMRVVPGLLERGMKVVDLGADYRLPTAALYEATYGRPHVDAGRLGEAVYGLSELFGPRIAAARLVANPGCYATATLLALAPLVRSGAIAGPVIVDAKSGTSGAGQGPTATTHHPEAALTVHPYGTPTHRHVPEMRSVLATVSPNVPPLVFVPHLVPLVRGILCSIYPTPAAATDPAQWAEALRAAYAGSPFVHVGGTPRLAWAAGTNHCFLSVQSAEGMPVVFSVLDNLGKGGAAQAIQNANLMLGLPQELGLRFAGFGV